MCRGRCSSELLFRATHQTSPVRFLSVFGFPVVTYFPKDDPTRFTYLSEVANPLDLGTIAVRLHTGFYDSCADFAADVDTMVGNCLSYWGAEQRGGSENPAGQCYMQSATAMQQHVAQCLHGSLPHVA
mmetsp:Transcript_2286/g.3800  ORF Transcript_2286/g.3800 Transcript_2286/m.3800 type:complete len:128 (-) Transcript_2286:603-986(-)